MNDEQLIAALRTHEVGARSLDPERVIAGARRRRLRTWVASGLAVVLIAGTVTGVATLGTLVRKATVDPVVTPSQSSSPSASSSSVDTPITLGPVDPAKAEELATTCLGRSGEVVHAARVRDIDPKVEDFALVVRDTAGKLYSCFGFADELGGEALQMGPDAGTDPNGVPPGPVDRLTGGGESSSVGGPGTTRYIRFERWYEADSSVVRIRQRYVVHGVPTGPWFTADVVDGYAFMRSWLAQPIKKGDPMGINTVQLETHAVDKSGKSTRQFGPNEDTFPAEMFPE